MKKHPKKMVGLISISSNKKAKIEKSLLK